MSFAWGLSLISYFCVFVFIPLNAITNHQWNLHFWPEVKLWEFGAGALTARLDYQRTPNMREHWTVRTPTEGPLTYKTQHRPNANGENSCRGATHIQDPASPNRQQHRCEGHLLQTTSKTKINSIISRQDYHLTQPCQSEGGKEKNSA